jgi:hypothetical protein
MYSGVPCCICNGNIEEFQNLTAYMIRAIAGFKERAFVPWPAGSYVHWPTAFLMCASYL